MGTAGELAMQENDFAKAREHWHTVAEQQHPEGAHNLGVIYEHGRGTPRDEAAAAGW